MFFVLAKVLQGRKLSKCSIVSHLIFVEFYFWIYLRNMLEVDLGCIFLGSRSSLILKFFFFFKTDKLIFFLDDVACNIIILVAT